MMKSRLAKLERLIQGRGLAGCPMCRRRLAARLPVKWTNLAEGDPLPAPDLCPNCGVEWPRLVFCVPPDPGGPDGDVPVMVLSPLPYDPVIAGGVK